MFEIHQSVKEKQMNTTITRNTNIAIESLARLGAYRMEVPKNLYVMDDFGNLQALTTGKDVELFNQFSDFLMDGFGSRDFYYEAPRASKPTIRLWK